MSDDKPIDPENFDGIVLDHKRASCPLHGEVFRAQWPKGLPIFMVKAFQLATGIDSVWAEARRIHGIPEGEDIDVKKLEAVFDLKPICCRITRAQLLELYIDARIGTLRRCRVCNRKKLGVPYKTQEQDFEHLCFECVCSASSTNPNLH